MGKTKTWHSDLGSLSTFLSNSKMAGKSQLLGIFAFEAARTMCRILSLYQTLADDQISKIRRTVMRSDAVAYLISKDQMFLNRIVCTELIEELDRIAASGSRLGNKCSDPLLRDINHIYVSLKLGIIHCSSLILSEKEMKKKVKKMEKYILQVSNLYSETETLSEMEASNKRLQEWKNYSGPIQTPSSKADTQASEKKLKLQIKRVHHLQENSLYNQTFDKVVALIANCICTLYARICIVFHKFVHGLPEIKDKSRQLRIYPQLSPFFSSGPLCRSVEKDVIPTVSRCILKTPLFNRDRNKKRKDSNLAESTVGGAGLALRYANLIVMVENLLDSPESITYSRDELYRMMTTNLRVLFMIKLKKISQEDELNKPNQSLAEDWREDVKRILQWLAPMAHDTLKWLNNRNAEQLSFEFAPLVLKLQTLHFSEIAKTEAVMAEILVGLNSICRYVKTQESDFKPKKFGVKIDQ